MKYFDCKIYEYDEGCDMNYCRCLYMPKKSFHCSVNAFGTKRVQRARRALKAGKQITLILKGMKL